MAVETLVIISGLIAGWARKGSIWAITGINMRYLWVLPFAYILQNISIYHMHGDSYKTCIIVSYVLLLSFCTINRKFPGVYWAILGTFLNFLELLFNGLRMPALVSAVKQIGPQVLPHLLSGTYGKSIAMTSHTHLPFLGDIFSFRVPPMSIISVGDILFSVGLIMIIQHAMLQERGQQDNVPEGRTT